MEGIGNNCVGEFMDKEEIKTVLAQAISNLLKNQPDIYSFTSETGQSEWNLTHHLSVEIHKLFPEYAYDLEVVKHNYENKRPDIIFHKRNTNSSNFLIVEVKRDANVKDIQDDLCKINRHWLKGKLKYKFGASINLKTDKTSDITVLANPSDFH